MRKPIKVGLAILAPVIGAALITPLLVGMAVQDRFRAFVAQNAPENMDVKVVDYDNGWFNSTAKTVATGAGEPIEIDSAIHHGPWPFFHLATIKSRIADKDLPLSLKQLFHGPPLTVTTVLAITGGYTLVFSSPQAKGEITYTNGKNGKTRRADIDWGGLSGKLSVNGDRHRYRFSVPRLKTANPDAALTLADLQATGEGRSLESLDTNGDWHSRDTLTIGRFSAGAPHGGAAKLQFSAKLTDRATAGEEDTVDLGAHLHLSHFRARRLGRAGADAAFHIPAAELTTRLTGLKAGPLKALIARLRQLRKKIRQHGSGNAREMLQRAAVQYFPAILSRSPVYTLKASVPKTNHGGLELNFKAALAEPAAAPERKTGFRPANLLQRLSLKASASADRTLLNWVLANTKQPPITDTTLQRLAQAHLIELADGRISSKVYASADKLQINGRPAPAKLQRAFRQGLLLLSVLPAAAAQ